MEREREAPGRGSTGWGIVEGISRSCSSTADKWQGRGGREEGEAGQESEEREKQDNDDGRDDNRKRKRPPRHQGCDPMFG